jgi:hypothetical protein
MKTYRLAVHTGPTQVASMAQKFSLVSSVTCEGTERVHFAFDCDPRDGQADNVRYMFLQALQNMHGTKFGLDWRDVEVLPS